MSTHLAWAHGEDDEFLHPTLGWQLIVRAIAYDSWIHWRHALPKDRAARQLLNEPIAQAITQLATALDRVHQRLPGYQQLGHCPFRFHSWWSPYAEGPQAEGQVCLFLLKDDGNNAFLRSQQPSDKDLVLTPAAYGLIEARLVTSPPATPPGARGSGDGPPRSPGGPRTRRNPLPRTPASAPAGPAPEP
jgi:hypothetical protein